MHDEVMRERRLGGCVDLVRRGVQPAELDVFVNGIVKEKRLLGNEPDLLAERALRQSAQVSAIDPNDPAR